MLYLLMYYVRNYVRILAMTSRTVTKAWFIRF